MSKEGALIAVVDDEEPVRRALCRLLRLAGLEVEAFASGATFLESLRNHTPDCLVLDLHMPETDGFEVESHLAHSGFRIPIVVITGRDTPADRERMIERGAKAFLQKPLDLQALLAAISAATKRSIPNQRSDD
jgi:two-component system, LuxR family, response regulator FixJ